MTLRLALAVAAFGLACALSFAPPAAAAEDDPDLPRGLGAIDKESFLKARAQEIALRRGYVEGESFDVSRRTRALEALEADERARAPELSAYRWTSLGPEPIPNGQTTNVVTAVSGRTISIAIHPTDPNKVYAGTANGGLYRTLDGGATWKALTDNAASLAIGAVTIDPSNPTTVWIGTGEGNGSADSFAGVGIYRILNAESASPTLEGPFGTRVAGCGSTADNGVAFQGTSITRIAFDPNDPTRMFVGNSTGVAGIGVGVALGGSNGRIGLWLSANANAATPTFSLCVGTGAFAIKDIVFEPGSSSNMLYHLVDRTGGTAHGVYRTTNANAATISPSAAFTGARTLNLSASTVSAANGELAINKVGATVTAVVAHGGGTNGQVQVSTNGGATWGAAITSANGYCGGQCFYDIAVAIDPTTASRIYIGGSATGTSTRIFARATTGTNFAASENGLHADTHAIAVAPSNPAVIYTGNDGGIYRSNDNGATWTSLNVAGFNATQFMSLATHASDPEFMIGGTQDNGTQLKRTNGTWTRTDFGDGGYALIDQSSTSTASIQMYHTYFNAAGSVMGYARQTSPTAFENWDFRGCGGTASGISCTATAVRFYAPIALGPGTPNTVYYGNDRLYRSSNTGTTHTVVSQAPIVSGVAISAIGIAPSNDNVRIVGLNNGGIFRTTTGAATLNDVDTGNTVPSFIVSRAVIDRNNSDIAYVALSGYTTAGQGIWRTANLSAATPTWTAAANGIPSIPINALVIDPRNSAHLYAGTDIGVYRSTDSGANWSSFSVGLPRTPVFDIAFQAATLSSGQHTLRIATHGRGIWEIGIRSPPSATTEVATNVSRTGATLNGVINDNLFSTTVSFEYGTTPALGSTIAATPGTVNTQVDTNVSAVLTGLTPNTLYYYRVVGTNTVGTSNGATQTFFTNGMGLQVGRVVLGATKQADFNRVTRVRFAQQFPSTPVVVAQVSNEDADPTALRVFNVSTTGFDLLQVEAPGCTSCNGANGSSTVNWIASAQGSYQLVNQANGSSFVIKAGIASTTATQRNTASGFAGWPATAWQAISFPTEPERSFSTPPVVLTGLQGWANEGSNLTTAGAASTLVGPSQPWATAVARNVSASGFDLAIEASEVDDDDAAPAGFTINEQVGYIAIQSGLSARILPFGGGGQVGVATGTSTATDVCANLDLAFPAGTTIVATSLRGFGGKQTRTDADGGWLRLCSTSNPSGLNVRAQFRVDEDADLDAERVHATAETVGGAIFGSDFNTTPVSLALLESQRIGSRIDVQLQAATEVAHLGYRIWGRRDAQDDWRPLHTDLWVAGQGGDSLSARSHRRQVEAEGVGEIRIEDIDIRGQSRFHAPVSVGARMGAAVVPQPLDWAAIRAANAATPQRLPGASSGLVLAEVSTPGVQRVRVSELLAQGLPVTAQTLDQLAVMKDAEAVARWIECPDFPSQCEVEWLAETRASLYGRTQVYALSLNAAAVRSAGLGALREQAMPAVAMAGEQLAYPSRVYSFSAPGEDPWYDERVVATTTAVQIDRSFELVDRVDGPVSLELALWGGLDFPDETPDHSVAILLNGVELDRRRFDGLRSEIISLSLPSSLLAAQNTLSLRVLADTGYAADVVMLDGYTLRYPQARRLRGTLSSGRFGPAQQAEVLSQGGFETRAGHPIENLAGASVLWSQAADGSLSRDLLSAGQTAIDPTLRAWHAQSLASLARPQLRAGALPASTEYTDYLIVSHPLFEAALQPLINLQQQRGLRTRVVRTDAIYARAGHAFGPEAIRAFIAEVNPRFVLLVGGDSYDYDNHLGLGAQSYLPTFYRQADAIVRFAPSDHPYVDANGDGLPERAIGRIPARSVVELERALQSILARAAANTQRFFGASGGSAPGESFGIHARSLLSYLRQGQITAFGAIDEVGLASAQTLTLQALAGGSDWISYLGHSAPNRWAQQNLLDTQQLASVVRNGAPAIVSQWGCWNNYFVLPQEDTMAHALMLRSNRLAAMVLGSSSLAEDASHLALGTRFFDLIEDGRFGDEPVTTQTIGEALMAAKLRLLQEAPEHREAVYSMTLFGDPASPLPQR